MDDLSSEPSNTIRRGRGYRRGPSTGGVILIVLGALLLLRNIYPWFRFEDYWPVILIAIGVVLIWRSRPL